MEIKLNDDYKSFLADFGNSINELKLSELAEWKELDKVAVNHNQLDEYGDISTVYSPNEFKKANTPDEDNELYFWTVPLLEHAYIIGKGYGGDPIIQVTQGKHKGEIYIVDHEIFYGFYEYFGSTNEDDIKEIESEFSDEELQGLDLRNLTTDQIMGVFTEELLGLIANNFKEFVKTYTHSKK